MRHARILTSLTVLGFLTCMLSAPGCAKKEKEKPSDGGAAPKKAEEGILLAVPSEEFHLRLLVDQKTKTAVAKVLDEGAKQEVAIDAEVLTFAVKGEKGDPIPLKSSAEKGKKSASFTGTHDRFGDKIDPKKVEVNASIGGKNYVFQFEEGHKH